MIAETIRHRSNLSAITAPAELVARLRLLASPRSDRVVDRDRLFNRLHDMLTDRFPGLEPAFDYATQRGPLVLLTEYQIPAEIRPNGDPPPHARLAKRHIRATQTARPTTVLRAALAQHTVGPGKEVATAIVAGVP